MILKTFCLRGDVVSDETTIETEIRQRDDGKLTNITDQFANFWYCLGEFLSGYFMKLQKTTPSIAFQAAREDQGIQSAFNKLCGGEPLQSDIAGKSWHHSISQCDE